ncbi:DUF3800 domain-containing protein [uncultured Alcanivorax sp.]|uniref:DUF3800 domain-containing protein n=1 Tax=Alcanivorax sp. IL2 TaxID=3396310 RepID=UPI00262FE7F3|nr:DUF3800 domain-containing protein [uncultured Alcanivorax sp.]
MDESGNTDLDTSKRDVSKYFIVCAVVIDNDKFDSLRHEVETIRAKYFQKGEIKSSSVRDRDGHARRIKILGSILELDFKFYAVAVEKDALGRDGGFKYKRSFLKFINGLLYKQLFENFPSITVFADEHGGDEFKLSFQRYIEKNHKPDLFWDSELNLVSSHDNVLVQLADFLVGTLAKVYEDKSNQALLESYRSLIKSKALDVKEWPTKHQAYFEPDRTSKEYDRFIHYHALSKAEIYIEKHREYNDEETRLQVCVLSHLVFNSRLSSEDGYIATKRLLEHLQSCGFSSVTEQAIRSQIVSKLRDKDVLIASCNHGYKIPSSYSDLYDFVERVNSLVLPLLERFNKARNSYLVASKGEVDLLKGPEYPELAEFLHALNK